MAERNQLEYETAEVARAYFGALDARDVEAMVGCWAPGGTDRFVGQQDLPAPAGVRRYFTALFHAFPDWSTEIVELTTEGGTCAVRWTGRATFAGPGYFDGVAPNGARIELEGCDVLQVRDGKIQHNDAYVNEGAIARQIGLLPPRDSTAQQRLAGLFNTRTRVLGGLSAPEQVAEGVWLVRGGFPSKTFNVFLMRDGDGVLAFDAGISSMSRAIAAAAAGLGGLTRVVLGHAHADHRGAASALGVPVLCHQDERADAEGDGGAHYWHFDELTPLLRPIYPHVLRHWDGEPVSIAQTLSEGDEVAGFNVVHLPGHAPGLIALWRRSDRLALVSDAFYMLDPQTGRPGHVRVPHRAFNQSTEQAKRSMRKLAALEPTTAWPGHVGPLTGDVRAQLEYAADHT